MTNGAAPAGVPEENPQGGDPADPADPTGDQGRTARECSPSATPGFGAPRRPATLYERWKAAFSVDGVAFGKKVRELREARGWSQKDLQQLTGVPISTISELENGMYERTRPALNMTMAQAFGYEHPAALLGAPEPAYPAGLPTLPWETSALGRETEQVLAGLLRGLWTAQEERGERHGRVTRLAVTLGVADVSDDPLPVEPPPPASGGASSGESAAR